jgi:hypothetical protein
MTLILTDIVRVSKPARAYCHYYIIDLTSESDRLCLSSVTTIDSISRFTNYRLVVLSFQHIMSHIALNSKTAHTHCVFKQFEVQ